jgi:RNA polymerase sigma-70 factor (ECF subfamily)
VSRFEQDKMEGPGGEAPDAIVERHWNAVHRLLFRLAGNDHDADDLTQETFLRALGRLDSYQPGTNMQAWLMRIASNAFFDLRRRRKTSRAEPLRDDAAAGDTPKAGPVETTETGALLADAIARLPDAQRVVFLLRSQEDLPFGRIAEVLGVTEDTARWHMLQARRQLMAELDGKI